MRAEAGTSANTFRVHSFSYLRAAACLAIVTSARCSVPCPFSPEEASATQALLSNIVVNNMMGGADFNGFACAALNPERPSR